jgi:uncharacterized protein CbrC (UPF0167 family)
MSAVDAASLPKFRYHPDPVATGSIISTEKVCVACELPRGWIYAGPTYCEADLDDPLCPWCIADGTAHLKFNLRFVDAAAVGDYGTWSSVPESVIEEVSSRTPSFNGFQQERWFTHCEDAAAFMGCAGRSELEQMDREVLNAIKFESGYTEEQWGNYFERMDSRYGPTAYLFRCLKCGVWGGYSDCP